MRYILQWLIDQLNIILYIDFKFCGGILVNNGNLLIKELKEGFRRYLEVEYSYLKDKKVV